MPLRPSVLPDQSVLHELLTYNTKTGLLTQVGSDGSFVLSGNNFGFDVNPTVDRIRVTSELDENIRLHPDTGVLVSTDTTLSYAAADVNSGFDPNGIMNPGKIFPV